MTDEAEQVARCETCRFFGHRVIGRVTTGNLCRRFPKEEQKHPADWCGEWSAIRTILTKENSNVG